jgi:tetratricopeptide (TPR) repeat protein
MAAVALPPVRSLVSDLYLDQARRLVDARRNPAAEAALLRAAQWNSGNPEILWLRHVLALDEGRAIEAIGWLQLAMNHGRDDLDTLYRLARLYSLTNSHQQEEIQLYIDILKRDPLHPEANYCLAMYYDEVENDRVSAVRHLKLARDGLPLGSLWRIRCDSIMQSLQGSSE